MRYVGVLVVSVLFGLVALGGAALPIVAQEEPPAVGDVVFEDPLTAPSPAVPPVACETGLGSAEFGPEGYTMRLRGRCLPQNSQVFMLVPLGALRFQDGEIKADVKVLSGGGRSTFYFTTRSDDGATTNYYSMIFPQGNQVMVGKNFPVGQSAVLSDRKGPDLGLLPADWNTFAVRMAGPKLWMLVNDQPVLMVEDDTATGPVARINFRRVGSSDDDVEAAIVVRNLRISALKDGDPSRAPTYTP
jgi:hypothetical protein